MKRLLLFALIMMLIFTFGCNKDTSPVNSNVSLKPPVLVQPANNAVDVAGNPILSWSQVTDATAYNCQVAKDSAFTVLVSNQPNLQNINLQLTKLEITTTYYWRVNSSIGKAVSAWATSTFTTGTTSTVPSMPVLLQPANREVIHTRTPIIQWQSSLSAVSYSLQVATDSLFSNFIINQNGISATNWQLTQLTAGSTYYWRVCAQNNIGATDYSIPYSFSIGSLPVTWAKTLDRGLSDWGNYLTETSDGGFVVIGPSSTDTTYMFRDIWLNKLDANGGLIWGKVLGDAGYDYGNWVTPSTDGGFYLFGGHSSLGSQMWLIKTDQNGNEQWDKKYGDINSYSWGIRACFTGDNRMLISGQYNNKAGVLLVDANGNTIWGISLDFDSSTTVQRVIMCKDGSFAGVTDHFIFKCDLSGNIQWYSNIYSSSSSPYLRSLVQLSDGTFIIISSNGNIIKTNSNGVEQWRYASNSTTLGLVDNAGTGIVFAGSTTDGYVFLSAMDYNQNILWSKSYFPGIATNVIKVKSGGFLLTGATSTSLDISSDVFVIKTDENGNSNGAVANRNTKSFDKLFKKQNNKFQDPNGCIRK